MKLRHRFTIIFILIWFTNGYAETTIPSYQESLNDFIEQSKNTKSKFSTEDKKTLQTANQSLAEKLPNPGIKVGEKAPNFTLKTPLGEVITLAKELKKGPVILVFYRGAWCPFCNMHLHVLKKSLADFKKFDAQLIAITPQMPDKSAKQIEKKGYPFYVLSDVDSQVMKDYKLYFELSADVLSVYKRGGLDIEAFNGKGRTALPVPGTFVINKDGIVQAMHAPIDYKSRMEPSEIIRSLESITPTVSGAPQASYNADVLNVIPSQKARASTLLNSAGLLSGNWASVDPKTFESTQVANQMGKWY